MRAPLWRRPFQIFSQRGITRKYPHEIGIFDALATPTHKQRFRSVMRPSSELR